MIEQKTKLFDFTSTKNIILNHQSNDVHVIPYFRQLKEMIFLFGMENRTLLKRDIIELLDNIDQPISVTDIRRMLGYSNITTILEICKELQTAVASIYSHGEFSLRLNTDQRGQIQLQRNSTNLQSLYNHIFSQDLTYDIFMELIEKRAISTIDFCLNYNISRSTLQRRIKRINKEIAAFDVRIICSDTLHFKADELKIRVLSYIFLWGIHRQFSNINLPIDTSYYKDLTVRIFDYLNIRFDTVQLELLSFWVWIISNAISKKKSLCLSESEHEIVKSFEIPTKPNFLPRWKKNEWEMLIIIIFDSDLYNFTLLTKDLPTTFIQLMNHINNTWLKSFSEHFKELSSNELEFSRIKITRYYLSNYFFETDTSDDIMDDVTHIMNLNDFKKRYPLYWEKFEAFWNDLIFLNDIKSQRSHRKLAALLLCLALYPLERTIPKIRVYISSDISLLFTTYLQQTISNHYKGKYELIFEKDLNKADLIISTAPFNNFHSLRSQKHLVVRSHMKNNDFKLMDQYLKDISS